MSDKNRNMNDINDQKTAEQRAFSEEIRRRLAEPGSGKPTLDEFKVMVYKDREKRRKKRNTMVACVVAAFVVGLFSFEYFVPKVGADKNPKETIQTEDGVIIEDGGYGSSVGEENVWVTEDWEQVADAKIIFPQMLIPKYIPTGYEFQLLTIETIVENDIKCEYVYKGEELLEIEIIIAKGGETALTIHDADRELSCKKGKIFLQDKERRATMSINDGTTAFIYGNLADQEIIDIMECIKD